MGLLDKFVPRQRSREEIERDIAHHRANAALLAEIGDEYGRDQEVRHTDHCLDELHRLESR